MLKFIIVGRRRPEDSQEVFNYNWGIIHVALMLTTPIVFQTFKRYVQHYSVGQVSNDILWHPQSTMQWGHMADHWMDGPADLVRNVQDPGYRARMQPHVFFDPSMLIEFTSGYTVYEKSGFAAGGVKLIHFLKKREDIEQSEFARRWKDEHAPLLLDALRPLGVLRKYVQSPKLALDPAAFKGTLFEMAHFGQYAGIEELWLTGLDDLTKIASDRLVFERIRASAACLTDGESSFAMVAMERVVYDAVTPGMQSPSPAILNPHSLEALIDAQGCGGWHQPWGGQAP